MAVDLAKAGKMSREIEKDLPVENASSKPVVDCYSYFFFISEYSDVPCRLTKKKYAQIRGWGYQILYIFNVLRSTIFIIILIKLLNISTDRKEFQIYKQRISAATNKMTRNFTQKIEQNTVLRVVLCSSDSAFFLKKSDKFLFKYSVCV